MSICEIIVENTKYKLFKIYRMFLKETEIILGFSLLLKLNLKKYLNIIPKTLFLSYS